MSLTFVVGTGRCGSTALSRVLSAHPDVLSVSELVVMGKKGPLRPGAGANAVDGATMWRHLSAPMPLMDAFAAAGRPTPEMAYPYGKGRFDPAVGVPAICHMTLPMLTADPDGLYDQLAAEVPRWPSRPLADQYRALFAFLASLLGRKVVVERSGSSLAFVRELRRDFPEARFVHMYRSGPECALSMSRHPLFRLRAASAEVGRLRSAGADLPPRLASLLAPPYDPERLSSLAVPLTFFGEMWTGMITAGLAALGELPSGTWSSLRYEDLLREPEAQLAGLAGFLGVPAPPGWLATAGGILAGRTAGAASAEPAAAELAALTAACEPGERAIATARQPLLTDLSR
ncbi:MAG TPA: sulfotransferase [Streptosporangiaceae bacterium]|nr:sulfotransferase [Streptosporangiaceae bacterium]